ncbi:carbonic anhydrase [Allosphingosinicella indica]|uniref:Carbonic anhydrase n=1 Tax=Allosphingosinicella indica TaxID=941907 RepID=A0A1X7GZ04_9SPHN|nr:carbonic anhydrase [Allosphingosinicella indica]SMF76761.1 carbonic anhydrase [Allosphingosinicella indica]
MADFNALIEGYRRFRANGWAQERERWEELASGQSPKVMVVACSDSRVDPVRIFDSNPGEIFVVRNVANLVPPYEPDMHHHGVSAALEFAVSQLRVEEVIVMGHGACGGCAAALTDQFVGAEPGEGGFIARWIDLLDPARERVLARHEGFTPEAFRDMELESVRVSLGNLRTFPWVADREAEGALKLRGAFFAIADGVLHLLDEAEGAFRPA